MENIRRHDLDWLRVLVFGLLIFYHVGMLFVPWGFHIKNNRIYDWLIYPMLFLNQWRLPILFVISGMGTYYALSKRIALQFSLERLKRLLVPLVFGMLIIVPPQVYVERLLKGQYQGGYFDFWPTVALTGIYPEGNLSWHHLWFLPYLLLFSLVLIPLFVFLRKHPEKRFLGWLKQQTKQHLGLYWFAVPLYLVEFFIEPFFPVTHALVDDWFTIINYLLLFSFGYLLISVQDEFWIAVKQHRKRYLLAGVLVFTLWLTVVLQFEDSLLIHGMEALLKVLNLWSWILAIFGYAAYYLNRPSKVLSYANQAVYPFYILHQTVMLIIAYFLIDWKAGLVPKFILLMVGTFGITWVLYEYGIRRWLLLRPLFGMKKLQNTEVA
ncbi:MAG: acyltransferase family protein [Tunicatimonas sp.]|uniref:acyltransferase family protein n=1 Tax=Tunicatimonas sp. TaxID=1940096 RepID=UPI003C75F197